MTSDVTPMTFLSLFLPFLAALAAPALVKRFGHNAAWILAIAPALSFVHFALMLPQVAAGGVVTGGYAWVPSFNLSFSWFIDGLSLTFAREITLPLRELTHTSSSSSMPSRLASAVLIWMYPGSSASLASAAQLPVIERHE